MEEYLTVKELSLRIKFSKQTIYNLISNRVFVLGEHYLKPRPKKILFQWSKVKKWLERPSSLNEDSSLTSPLCENNIDQPDKDIPNNLINI